MIENKNSNIEIKIGSEKNFGLVFSIFFALISFLPIYFGNEVNFYTLILSLILLSFTLFFPKIFTLPNYYWFKFGILLGKLISPIILLILYIIVFLPFGIIFKIRGINLLDKNFDSGKKSYWRKRINQPENMENQF